MFIDLLNGFRDYYGKYGDSVILKHYKMKQGLYARLSPDGILDIMHITDGAKEKDFEGKHLELFRWFRERDYNSILIQYDTNKKVASKSIHSNNLLTVFAKRKSFYLKTGIDKKMLSDIDEYFNKFEQFGIEENAVKEKKEERDPKKAILLETDAFDFELLNASRKAFGEHIHEILEMQEAFELDDNDYIRIFFDADIDVYEAEYKRYMVRKVFNKDKYHSFIGNKVYGLSNVDMGTNPNKPSLELKGMKCTVPFKLDLDSAILLQKLFDFLCFYNIKRKNKSGEVEYVNSIYKTLYIPYDFNIEDKDLTEYNPAVEAMHYIRTGNGISFNIVDYDIIPPYQTTIDFELIDLFVQEDEEGYEYDEIKTLYQLEKAVNYYFFEGNLTGNYFVDKIDSTKASSKNVVTQVYRSRHSFYDWFHKGDSFEASQIVDDVSKIILNNRIRSICEFSDLLKVKNIFNLRMALLKHFGQGGTVNLKDINAAVEKVMLNKDVQLDNDKEFYYLSGQLAAYLLSKSESKNKTQLMIQAFLNCKNLNQLKTRLREMHKKYSYAISLNDYRFNNTFVKVLNYDPESDVKDNSDMLIAGILSKNLFYKKRS